MAKRPQKQISDFGRRVGAAAERSGKTRYRIAKDAGMSLSYLYQLIGGRASRPEGGGVDRAVSIAKRLAEACGCSVEELLGL